jgi:hypothetical protein
MSIEELLRREREREGVPPNPLLHRIDDIVARVRRRRRARAAAAGAVVSAAVLAVLTVVGGRLPAAETDISSASPSRTAAPVPLWLVSDSTPLDPGRYVITVLDATSVPLLPVLSVPAGYVNMDAGFGVRSDDESRHVWASDVNSVYTHPCQAGAVPEPVLPSAAHLANALFAQPLRTGQAPVAVTVGGHQGFYVELTVPDDVDVTKCPRGRFELWPGHSQNQPGQVDMIWVLEVKGQRITINASHGPDASPQQVAELKRMVTTATFAPREGP